MKVCLQTKCESSTHAPGRLYRGKYTQALFLGVKDNKILNLQDMSLITWSTDHKSILDTLSAGSKVLLKSDT